MTHMFNGYKINLGESIICNNFRNFKVSKFHLGLDIKLVSILKVHFMSSKSWKYELLYEFYSFKNIKAMYDTTWRNR